MESPSSTRRVTRSQTLDAKNTNNGKISRTSNLDSEPAFLELIFDVAFCVFEFFLQAKLRNLRSL